MDHFTPRGGVYHCEDVPLPAIAAAVGTPAYVYSRATLKGHCERFTAAFASYPTLACFAVKANSNLSVLREIFASGLGADLVSLGELERALLAGARPETIVFSGVGKREDEVRRALDVGILMFNVESTYELDLLSRVARSVGKKAPVTLRLNPNIDAKTHEKIATGLYTTKFGLPETDLAALLDRVTHDPNLTLLGLGCHIGSQITTLGPIAEAAKRMAELSKAALARGHALRYVDMGGGLGIRYKEETPPSLEEYAATLTGALRATGLSLIVEPGRVLVGNMGILLTRVLGVKQTPARHFVVLDAAMNDLLRPSLYDSYHEILGARVAGAGTPRVACDFVGPVCETGDFLGKNREVALPAADDLVVIRSCGAYGSSMASHYNSRPRVPEVLVDGATFRVVRPRETLESLWAPELAALRDAAGPG